LLCRIAAWAVRGETPALLKCVPKVITLDPETSKKIFEKVLPVILGSIFGATDRHPDDNPQALPKVLRDARDEMDKQQPNASSVFSAILDQDHDGDVDLADLTALFRSKPRQAWKAM